MRRATSRRPAEHVPSSPRDARWPLGAVRGGQRRGGGCGAADVSSLDFFAGGVGGGSELNEVAKNSNAPRASADPFASRMPAPLANQRGVAQERSAGVVLRAEPGGRERSERRESKAHGGAAAIVRRSDLGPPRATLKAPPAAPPHLPAACPPLPSSRDERRHAHPRSR
jgi:hypothetical protein